MSIRVTALSYLLAAVVTVPLADSLVQVPIQVSDSLEPMVIAARYPTVWQLLVDATHFSATTLRPMRYVQARWLLNTVAGTGLSYHTVFRGAHVALLAALVLLFVTAVRVRTWTDLAAFAFALPMLIGIHTFVAMLQEAFPVNHYAEIGVCALAVFVLARRPRWYVPPAVCVLLAFALSLVESGALVWVVVMCCGAVGMGGITRSTVVSATLLFAGYLVLRHTLGLSSPGIGGHNSGFGAVFYSADELQQRFGAHPLGFMMYNVVGGLLSLLLSEPRTGVYRLAIAWQSGDWHPVLLINMGASVITTGLIVWYGATRLRRNRQTWTDADRTFAVACVVMLVNAMFTAAYIKDDIISVGGLFYAIAGFVAVREILDTLPHRGVASTAFLALVLTVGASLWTFRAAGVHYLLRYDAFTTRNDWVEVLRPDRKDDWPTDPRALAITRGIRDEAISKRVASPSFMPRWGDRYWVE